ncbi:MAG TPA: carboxypeptidase-like regulatory domain-containing protein [Tepidiformaceae bacterium]|nr:carboxypeptidase-like regulatory domain-containing protein [Candidatus Eisenbacteria bacterium]HEX6032487.1 carboxypeptidase-like regulatory domain-containing protein [Tepidiformaceae bacterium]
MDSKGRPIPGGYLRFEPIKGLATVQFNEYPDVDSSGSFRVDLYPGRWNVQWNPSFSSNVYQDYEATDRTVEVSADHSTLEWIVDGIVVQGGVKDPSGATVDSFGVYATNARYEARASTTSGHYELYLAPGTYAFHAFGQYGSGLPSQSFGQISVQNDTTLDFQFDGIEITGTVRGPGSVPLVAAAVQARGETNGAVALSDASGNYRMYLPPQDVRFRISPAETWILQQLTTSTAIAGPAQIDFNLGATEWTGTVTRSDTAAPVADAKVTAFLVADALERRATATTDASGQFRLAVEPGREYDLLAVTDSMQSAKVSRVAGADSSFALEIIVPGP